MAHPTSQHTNSLKSWSPNSRQTRSSGQTTTTASNTWLSVWSSAPLLLRFPLLSSSKATATRGRKDARARSLRRGRLATAMKWRERGGEVGSDAKTILEVVGEGGSNSQSVGRSDAQSRSDDDAGRRLLEAKREGRKEGGGYGGIGGGGGVKALLRTYVGTLHWKSARVLNNPSKSYRPHFIRGLRCVLQSNSRKADGKHCSRNEEDGRTRTLRQ